MSPRIDAIYEDGVFPPVVPVPIADGERVSLRIEARSSHANDLGDVEDLLDTEFMDTCRARAGHAHALADIQSMLSAFHGSLSDRIAAERDDR